MSYWKNTVLNYIGIIVTTLIAFFANPMLINTMGDDSYAVFRLVVFTVVTYACLFDMGIGVATNRLFAKFYYKNDIKEANAVISSSLVFYSLMWIVILVLMVVLSFILPDILRLDEKYHLPFYCLMFATSVYILFKLYSSVLQCIFTVLSRYDLIQAMNVIDRSVLYIGALIVIPLFYESIYATVISTLIASFLAFIFGFLLLNKFWKNIKFNFSFFDFHLLKSMLSFGIFGMLVLVGPIVLNQTQPIIISRYLGLTEVSYFSVVLLLYSTLATITAAMCSSLYPLVLKAKSENNMGEVASIYSLTIRRVLCLTTIILIPLVGFGDVFLCYWINPEYKSCWDILIVVCISIFLMPMTIVSNYVLNGAGEIKFLALFSILSAIICLSINIFLLKYTKMALMASAISFAIPYSLRGVASCIYACVQLKINVYNFIFKYVISISPCILVGSVVVYLFRCYLLPTNLFQVFLYSGIVGVFILAMSYFFVLDKKDTTLIHTYIKKLNNRIRIC